MTKEELLFMQQLGQVDLARDADAGFMLGAKVQDRKRMLDRERSVNDATAEALAALGPDATPEEKLRAIQSAQIDRSLLPEAFATQEKAQSGESHGMDLQLKKHTERLKYLEEGAGMGDAILDNLKNGKPVADSTMQQFEIMAARSGYRFDKPGAPTPEEIQDYVTGAKGVQKNKIHALVNGMRGNQAETGFLWDDGTYEKIMSGDPATVQAAGINAAGKENTAYTTHKTKQIDALKDSANLAKFDGALAKYDWLNGKQMLQSNDGIRALQTALFEEMDAEYKRTGGKPPYLSWDQALDRALPKLKAKLGSGKPADRPPLTGFEGK